MRKEIETSARWYIPVYIITLAISVFGSFFLGDMIIKKDIPGPGSIYFMLLSTLTKYLDNLVIAIWLYFQLKNDSGRKWIWLFFGLVAHLYAAVLYLGLKIYEQRNKTFNNAIETVRE